MFTNRQIIWKILFVTSCSDTHKEGNKLTVKQKTLTVTDIKNILRKLSVCEKKIKSLSFTTCKIIDVL